MPKLYKDMSHKQHNHCGCLEVRQNYLDSSEKLRPHHQHGGGRFLPLYVQAIRTQAPRPYQRACRQGLSFYAANSPDERQQGQQD